MDKKEIKMMTREEALELLVANNSSQTDLPTSNESVFDAYGNYSYPFDAKIKEPNIATGYVFAEVIPVN